jgi:hypothetical protein
VLEAGDLGGSGLPLGDDHHSEDAVVVLESRHATSPVELTRFGGHLTSWEDVHDAEGKAAVSA